MAATRLCRCGTAIAKFYAKIWGNMMAVAMRSYAWQIFRGLSAVNFWVQASKFTGFRAAIRVFAAAFGAQFTLNRLNLTAFFTVRF